jgi:hypothetical protein
MDRAGLAIIRSEQNIDGWTVACPQIIQIALTVVEERVADEIVIVT